ncbi:MAG: hemerythrin domain-containing protein [Sphingomonas sp.]|nr:hemerythrin domain-containing protein [Sphingomonas sp.]
MSYQKLIEEHDRIDAALIRLTNVLEQPDRDVAAAADALDHLADELRAHLAHEDVMLYNELIAARKPAFGSAVDHFNQQFDVLRRDWDTYLQAWGPDQISANWDCFRTVTKLMVERLAERVAAENDLLYCAALQAGVITLRGPQAAAAA